MTKPDENCKNIALNVDITSVFCKYFQDKKFETYDEFCEHMDAFCSSSCTAYIKKTSTRFKDEGETADHLVYSHVKFACNRPDCPAFFSLGTKRKHHLLTRRYSMLHNHSVDAANPDCVASRRNFADIQQPYMFLSGVDHAAFFAETIASKSFATFDEFTRIFGEFQKETGTFFVKRNSTCFKPDSVWRHTLVYTHLNLVCTHQGRHQDSIESKQKRKSLKMGCPASIWVVDRKGQLCISRYFLIHNHEVRKSTDEPYSLKKQLSSEQKDFLKSVFSCGISNQDATNRFNLKFGLHVSRDQVRQFKAATSKKPCFASQMVADEGPCWKEDEHEESQKMPSFLFTQKRKEPVRKSMHTPKVNHFASLRKKSDFEKSNIIDCSSKYQQILEDNLHFQQSLHTIQRSCIDQPEGHFSSENEDVGERSLILSSKCMRLNNEPRNADNPCVNNIIYQLNVLEDGINESCLLSDPQQQQRPSSSTAYNSFY